MALRLISQPITPLGDEVDLDTITATGVYHQDGNVRARNGANYPEPAAGLLEVHNPAGSAMVYQRYTCYQGRPIYYRGRYNGQWSPWRKIQTA